MEYIKKIYNYIYKRYSYVARKKYSTLAGSLAFFFMLSIIPFIFLVLLFLKLFNFDNSYLDVSFLPERVGQLIDYIVNSQMPNLTTYSIFLIGTSFYTASNIFYQIMQCGEFIYNKKRKINFYKKKFITIIGVLIVITMLILTIFLNLVSDQFISKIASGIFIIILKYILTIFFPVGIVIFVNILVAPYKLKIKYVLRGSFFTLLFWIVASLGFNIYFRFFSNIEEFYGALTFVIITFLYIYILAQGLIIGFILNQRFLNQKK